MLWISVGVRSRPQPRESEVATARTYQATTAPTTAIVDGYITNRFRLTGDYDVVVVERVTVAGRPTLTLPA